MEPELREQLKLENNAWLLHVTRHRKRLAGNRAKGQQSLDKSTRWLLSEAVTEVSNYLDQQAARKVTYQRLVLKAFQEHEIDHKTVAYLALKVIFDCASQQVPFANTALEIGRAVEDEIRMCHYQGELPDWFHHILRGQSQLKATSRHRKKYSIIHSFNNKAQITWDKWPRDFLMNTGLLLLHAIKKSTGLIAFPTTWSRNKKLKWVTVTPAALDWLEDMNRQGEEFSQVFIPCIIPPKDWSGPQEGGYYSHRLKRLNMIRTHMTPLLYEYKNVKMPRVYQTLNTLQGSEWGINGDVYEVLEHVWDSGEIWAGLPSRNPLPVPEDPLKHVKRADMNREQQEIWKAFKVQAKIIHDQNEIAGSKRLQLMRTIQVAREYAEKNFHYVYFCDFRGRAYNAFSFLSPQGPDYSRSLLQFGKGLPVENLEQEKTLAVHGANVFGHDKVSLTDRWRWVKENESDIAKVAEDPLKFNWWTEADKPFCFLAFCKDWSKYIKDRKTHLSHLPCAVDGSNNGLQHFSMLLRDESGGRMTNLTPATSPQDIYQAVADRTKELVTSRAIANEKFANEWLEFGITRKLCKRPVMIIPYGGTQHSMRQYIMDHVKELTDAGKEYPFDDGRSNVDSFYPSGWLASLVRQSINEIIISAREAMNWIQQVSQIYSETGYPMIWTTPSDFICQMNYPKLEKDRVKTVLDGSIYTYTEAKETGLINQRRVSQGASPNFIHSLDAAHMMLTTLKANTLGVDDFQMIHDSYGTHAHNLPLLSKVLREEFHGMYQEDHLEGLRNQLQAYGPELPPPPQGGSLDTSGVLKSQFFFC